MLFANITENIGRSALCMKNKKEEVVKMDKFERLNRETREYNNKNIDRFNNACNKYGSAEYWRNYWNNQTYKKNNGEYSKHY